MTLNLNQKSLLKQNNLNYPLDIIGKIRDPLHNTIPYTASEKVIIDRPEFQRLRRIHQTAFIQYVFPGATHTRFEHSLGAMHISGLLLSSLLSNQKRTLSSLEKALEPLPIQGRKNFSEQEKLNGSLLNTKSGLEILENSPYLAQCLRFAALLHDCGHSALSHSGERFMPSWNYLKSNLSQLGLPPWLSTALESKMSQMANLTKTIRHEIYTLFLVHKLFQYKEEFLDEKMGQDICAILDTSVAPHPEGDLVKSKMQFLFHEVISGEIDVDRMDYLLRDSKECGVVYGYFDLGRILDSVGFYLNIAKNTYHLALRRSGISAYEDYLRARLSMYHQVYFHKTATACEAMLAYLKEKSPFLCFPIDIDDYIKLDDYNIISFFNPSEKNKVTCQLSKELLLERKLWKRVYEETIPSENSNNISSSCYLILKILKELKIPCEIIETSTNLTSFSPIKKNDSTRTLKIILKNVNDLRFLDTAEKHCPLINRVDEDFIIKRIYISRYYENGEKIDTNAIQKLISDKLTK